MCLMFGVAWGSRHDGDGGAQSTHQRHSRRVPNQTKPCQTPRSETICARMKLCVGMCKCTLPARSPLLGIGAGHTQCECCAHATCLRISSSYYGMQLNAKDTARPPYGLQVQHGHCDAIIRWVMMIQCPRGLSQVPSEVGNCRL